MRKLIFSIITLLGLSATAELNAQFLSADLQADDLRGNVAKVEYEGNSTYGLNVVQAYYYDNNGHLTIDCWGYPNKITRANNKISKIEIMAEEEYEMASYTYNGNLISKIVLHNGYCNLFYNQSGNLIRKEETLNLYNGDTGRNEPYKATYHYTILERDSKGNWIKRSVKSTNKWGTETQIETRKITYR